MVSGLGGSGLRHWGSGLRAGRASGLSGSG